MTHRDNGRSTFYHSRRRKNPHMSQHLDGRVSKLEALFEQMTLQFKELGANFNSWARDTREEIRSLAKGMRESGKTNWGVIFGALALAFSLVTSFIRPVEVKVESHTADIVKLHQQVDSLRERAARTEAVQELMLRYELKPKR